MDDAVRESLEWQREKARTSPSLAMVLQEFDALAAEVHALRNDRRNARGFIEAMRARGSMPEGTYLALLGYLGDAPPRATEGEA